MERRSFLLAASCAVLARRAAAQTLRRVAWISPTRAADGSVFLDELVAGLRDLGRRDVAVEPYWAEDSAERQTRIVAEAIATRPAAIVAYGSSAIQAHRTARDIPIVFGYSGDPVEAGLVTSLARPGGSATGISYMTHDLVAKRMEILREALPNVRRVAVVANPQHPGDSNERRVSQQAADGLGLELLYFDSRTAGELPDALAAVAAARVDAAMFFPVQSVIVRRADIAAWALERRIPTISGWAQFAEGGNLMSYGANLRDVSRRLATFLGRVLGGARPADLPVEQPTKVELAINLRTARALGLDLPLALLARADEILE